MPRILHIRHGTSIPVSEVRFTFTRSGGHGGQNVNKVETRVQLTFDVAGSMSLSEEERATIFRHLGSRIDKEGVLHLVEQQSRSQVKNREAALARFVELVRHALRPRKKRVPTGVPRASREKRLEQKKRRGGVKRDRRVPLE